jgi:hypothetical protein
MASSVAGLRGTRLTGANRILYREVAWYSMHNAGEICRNVLPIRKQDSLENVSRSPRLARVNKSHVLFLLQTELFPVLGFLNRGRHGMADANATGDTVHAIKPSKHQAQGRLATITAPRGPVVSVACLHQVRALNLGDIIHRQSAYASYAPQSHVLYLYQCPRICTFPSCPRIQH